MRRSGKPTNKNMAAAASNVAAEVSEITILEGGEKSSSDDNEESIDLGISAIPPVNFSRPKNDFETINLDGDDEGEEERSEDDNSDEKRKKRKYKKKRKKHPVEEPSDSSSDDDSRGLNSGEGGLSDLTWRMWVWYYIVAVSSGAYRAAEYLGEKLAAFFGITTPKYQYVLDEYYRLKELEKEEQEQDSREREFVAKREAERLEKLEGGASANGPTEEGITHEVHPSEQRVLLDDRL